MNVNDLKKVVPIPTGGKVFVSAHKEEKVAKSGIILVNAASELLDVQEVVQVGEYMVMDKEGIIKPGDVVKINFDAPHFYRKRTSKSYQTKPDNESLQDTVVGQNLEFNIKIYTFAGQDLLLIDKSDIEFVWKKEDINKK